MKKNTFLRLTAIILRVSDIGAAIVQFFGPQKTTAVLLAHQTTSNS
jgi:hypothetical protein